jgi:chromosomal replication initiator protein
VVKAYQRKTFDEFKDKYHSLDLLLIDDVQFFANKDRTQEEFFNAFEALLAKKSHIVMTSDTYPKGLADIHERLVSRFDSGLTVAIEPPELEMRVAILINKARAEGTRCPRKWPSSWPRTCAPTCASSKARCARSWRTRASTRRRSRSSWRARRCATCCRSRTGRSRVENIQKTVADYYKIKVADMYSKKRPASHRPAAADRDVPGQGTDAEKPARDRRAVRRPRPHDGAARGAQDLGRAPELTELNQQLHVLEQTLKG